MSGDMLANVQAFAAISLILFGGGVGAVVLRGLWRWVDRGTRVASGELEDLKTRVTELEADRGQVAELEERLDFAERLLARQSETDKLPEGR